jgi:rhamnopyranosyl-N-acetylglucosaminyl-diphospho-decaprenol beta-1,3/1,4-galactofuranosyltransferase
MLHALAMGADWIWLGDDDGRPPTRACWHLVDVADRRGLAAVSPWWPDKDDPDRLAFPGRARSLAPSRARCARDVEHGADRDCCPTSPRCQRGAVPGRHHRRRRRDRTCGCSSAATR